IPIIGRLWSIIYRIDNNAHLCCSTYCWSAAITYFILKTILPIVVGIRSEEHTSELQSRENLVCRLLLEKKKIGTIMTRPARGERNRLGGVKRRSVRGRIGLPNQ